MLGAAAVAASGGGAGGDAQAPLPATAIDASQGKSDLERAAIDFDMGARA